MRPLGKPLVEKGIAAAYDLAKEAALVGVGSQKFNFDPKDFAGLLADYV